MVLIRGLMEKKYKPELLRKEYEIISNKLNEPELTTIVFQNFKRLLMTK